jgi:hypothetical protein
VLRVHRPLRFLLERHGLQYVLLAGGVLYLVAVALLTLAEEGDDRSIARYREWLWWGITQVTSLDFASDPQTNVGRGIAVFVALLGIALVSIVTANIAALLLHSQEEDSARLDEILRRLESIDVALRAGSGDVSGIAGPTTRSQEP